MPPGYEEDMKITVNGDSSAEPEELANEIWTTLLEKNDIGPYLVYNIFVTHLLNCSNLHREQKEKKNRCLQIVLLFFYPADKVYI